ncbi:hypothetical protein [Kosakonia sacchari]|uniref:hypothetical protein n=1 Tax=Kosakonia sacchari TaxID=1158459 RepID=UPI0015771F1C|nr:hypothetical protein [Kosakonia sacchari]
MEFLDVAEGLERIELLAKVTHMEDVTMREQHVALLLIGEWAREINGKIKAEVKNPRTRGSCSGRGFQ